MYDLAISRCIDIIRSSNRRSYIVESSMFTREQVLAVAALANLDLTDEEVEMFTRQLAEILAYADEVQQIDTRGVPPTASVVTPHPADRADEVRPSLPPEDALAN